MPAKRHLTGQQFGALTVTGLAPSVGASGNPAWQVRCRCGAVEIYPQRRLTEDRPSRPAVRACTRCTAPRCVVCNGPVIDGRKTRVTCSDACQIIHRRDHYRASYHRRMADPAIRTATRAAAKTRRQQRAADDPEWAAAQSAAKKRWKARREATDPELAERRQQRARAAYAANAAAVNAGRRARLAEISDAALIAWIDRARAYGRAYRKKWRAALQSDPASHRAYLDLMAEYRRQRRLQRLLAEATPLMEPSDV